MKRIILIDSKWDIKSDIVQYVLKSSKGTDTEISAVFLAADSAKETAERAETTLKAVKQEFASAGISFSPVVVGPDAEAFMTRLEGLKPASLVLIGDVRFSDEMKKGGVSVESLKEKFTCPVTTVDAITGAHAEKKAEKGINWGKWIVYAIGSVIMYGVFFPKIGELNEKIFMTESILGGLAIMAVVAIHAWIWGNTTQILPKLFKLEK